MRFAIAGLILASTSIAADTEIHRCLQDDGTIAFQEMPCPEPAAKAGDDAEASDNPGPGETAAAEADTSDFVNPFDEPAPPATPSEPPLPEPVSQNRAECEKTTRDAIDAIDLEMRENTYTKEQGREYLEELLALTAQLRACKP